MEQAERYTRKTVLALAGLIVCLFLYSMDATVVSTAMDTIVSDLDGLRFYAWPFTVYLLCSTISLPVSGRTADIVGNKPVFLTGVSVFMVGSVLCGLAPTMPVLIACRGLQGLGGGALLASAFTIPAGILPKSRHGGYVGLATSLNGIASIVGPLVGGLLTDLLGWRWIFFLNVPFSLVAMLLVTANLRRMPPEKSGLGFDLKGLVTFACSLVPLILALSYLGDARGFEMPLVVIVIAAALFAFIMFCYFEARAPSEGRNPLVPIRHLEDRDLILFLLMSFLNQVLLYVAILYLPYYFETTVQATSLEAGAVITPMMLGLLVADNISARIIVRGGSAKVLGICSFALTMCCMGLLAYLGTHDTYVSGTLLAAAMGFALGLNMPLSNSNVQKLAPHGELARMTSLVMFSKNMGRVVSAALFGVIFTLAGETVFMPFAVAAVLALAGAIAMGFLRPRTTRAASDGAETPSSQTDAQPSGRSVP